MNKLKFFGKRIKELRKKNHLTQEQLAEKIGVYPKQIGNIETGTCFTTFQTLEKLAQVFNVGIEELFEFSHIATRDELIKNITEMITSANDTQLSLLHRIIRTVLK